MKLLNVFKISFLVISILSNSVAFCQFSDSIKLNDIRIIASHNSYKKKPDPKLLKFLGHFKKQLGEDLNPIQLDYGHALLTQQMDEFGVRGFEFDLAYDPFGGAYTKRRLNFFVPGLKQKTKDTNMQNPGFKLLHIADVDYESNYPTFISALEEINTWSNNHPSHLPLYVNLEIKREAPGDYSKFLRFLGFQKAPKTDSTVFLEIHKEIIEVFGDKMDKLLKPKELKGSFHSVNERLLVDGWPKLNDCLGKIIFIIDGDIDGYYLNQLNNGADLPLFIYTEPNQSCCAFVIRNNPLNKEKEIKELSNYYIVRTRSDAGTIEARENNYTVFNAAIASEAQIISTDYYRADLSLSAYEIKFSPNVKNETPIFLLRNKFSKE